MKPYGMKRNDSGDVDVAGCIANGRATAVYSVDGRAYRSLSGGKKAAIRRRAKRVARAEGKAMASNLDF